MTRTISLAGTTLELIERVKCASAARYWLTAAARLNC
jgi:hypothetical protein